MFILVGPSVVASAGRFIRIARPRLTAALFAAVLLVPPLGYCLDLIISPLFFHQLHKEEVSYASAANTLEHDWGRLTGRPLAILAGDSDTAGGFAAFMNPRPSVLIDGMRERSPWITKQRISSEGVMIVWRIKDARQPLPPPDLVKPLVRYRVEIISPLHIKTPWDRHIPPVLIGRAIIPP